MFKPVQNIDVYTVHLAIHHHNHGKPHAHFCSRYDHDEEYHQLCVGIAIHFGKSNQQQVHRIQHKLNAHKDDDGIAPHERAHDADAKQGKRKEEVVLSRQFSLAFGVRRLVFFSLKNALGNSRAQEQRCERSLLVGRWMVYLSLSNYPYRPIAHHWLLRDEHHHLSYQ